MITLARALPVLSIHYSQNIKQLLYIAKALSTRDTHAMAADLRMHKEYMVSSLHRSSRLLTSLVMHTSYSESLSRESEQEKDHCTSLKSFMVRDIADVLESVQH